MPAASKQRRWGRLPRWLFVAVVLAVTLGGFLFGALKSYSVLGFHDTDLVFRASARMDHPDRVIRTLRWRFSAVEEYGVDFSSTPDEVHVVVENRLAQLATDLAAWDGDLSAHRIDTAYDLPLIHDKKINVEGPDENGGRRYTGSYEDLTKAVRNVEVEKDRRLLLAHLDGTKLYRTVVLFEKDELSAPALVFEAQVTPEGRGVDVRIDRPGAAEIEKLGDPSTYVLTGGKNFALLNPQISGDHIIASCGDDLRAYHRARRDADLLTAGHLPKLTVVSETSLPKNFELAAGHLAIPLLLVATWFAILRRFDRAQPEPWWLVLATGAIAMAINPLTFYLRTPLSGTDWGDPHLADHAGRIEAFPAELLAYCMRAGLVEELVKLLPILMLARWRKEFDEPIDGIIYAVASAVGFSCIEEFGYLLFGRLHASLLVVRATSTPPAHVFFTSVMGYALGQGIGKGIRGAPRVVAAYLCAAFLHGLYDTLLMFRPLYAVSRAYQIVLLLLFTFLVRRALRGSSAVLSPSKNAKLVRAGTWLSFGFFLALFAFGVSSLREIGNLTPPISTLTNAEVVGLAVVLSAAIAIVALRMVSSVPLDVVIDDAGLTFSGVTWPWSSIGSASETPVGDLFPMRRRIILDTSKGPFMLGPFTRTNASIVLAEVESRVPERQRVAPIPSVDVAGLRRAASDETDRARPPQ